MATGIEVMGGEERGGEEGEREGDGDWYGSDWSRRRRMRKKKTS
jgi:hypothetical protein